MEDHKYPELRPIDICMGNFIESMGLVQMVSAIVTEGHHGFRLGHVGWNRNESPLPDGVDIPAYPIPLTEKWKVCLGIEKYQLPEWIKFVHEAQNYFMWSFRINLHEVMNWELLPKYV